MQASRRKTMLLAIAACTLGISGVSAQTTWQPSQPVTLVVPYSPGGGTDTVGRLVASKLSDKWNVPVIVDNKAGGDGVIGGAQVARAKPDGHTLMLVVSSMAINPFVMPSIPTDPIKDFTPVTLLGRGAVVMVGSPKLPEKDLGEFLAAAKSAPGQRTFASTEPSSRLYGEELQALTGIELLNIPYKGGSQLMTDIMGGQVDVGFTSIASAQPHFKSGTLKLLGVAWPTRHPALPEVPSFTEYKVPLSARSWLGVFAPAGLDENVLNGLYQGFKEVLFEESLQAELLKRAVIAEAMPPAEFKAFFQQQLRDNEALVKKAGLYAVQ